MTTARIFGVNASQDRYVSELRSAYAGIRLVDPDYALQQDPYAYEKMLRDPIISAGIQGRARAAAGTEWRVDPPMKATDEEKRLAAFVELGLSEISEFRSSRLRIAKEILKGQDFEWIMGERRKRQLHKEDKPREWWVVTGLRQLDKRRVRYLPKKDRDGRVDEFDDMFAQYAPKYWGAGDGDKPEEFDGFVELDLRNVVQTTFEDSESRLGKGRGLADALYWTFYAKVRTLEYLLNWEERWSEGPVVVKIDTKKLSNTDTTTEKLRDDYIELIRKMRGRHAIAIDIADELEALDPGSIGPEKTLEVMRYFDSTMTRLIRGALLPSGGGEDTGSNARAETEEGSEDSVTEFDRTAIDDALTLGLVAQFVRVNAADLRDAGFDLDIIRLPKFVTSSRQRPDYTEATNRAAQLLDRKVDLVKDDLYQQTGFRMPTDEDYENENIIEGQEPVAAGVGAGGGFGDLGQEDEAGVAKKDDPDPNLGKDDK